MKRPFTRLMAGATMFVSLSVLFQNCGPAKVSTDGTEVTSSAELGSNSDQQPSSGSNPSTPSTPVVTPTPGATPSAPGATPTPTPAATPEPTPTPIQGPALKASATMINYGSVSFGMRSTKTVTLTNIGTSAVTINNKLIVNPDFSLEFFGANLCGNSLGVGLSCNLSVTFTPFDFGKTTGVLQIQSNAPNSPLLIQLEGSSSF